MLRSLFAPSRKYVCRGLPGFHRAPPEFHPPGFWVGKASGRGSRPDRTCFVATQPCTSATRNARRPTIYSHYHSISMNIRLAHKSSPTLLVSLPALRGRGCASRNLKKDTLTHFKRTVRRNHSAVPISTIYFAKEVLMSDDSQTRPKEPTFPYTQLWASKDGETHIAECFMTDFDFKKYASANQFVKDGGKPLKTVFTELSKGFSQDLHCCPQVQIVITLRGSWYVETTDGTKKVFTPGEILFQDNTKDCPSDKEPMHYSGVVGDEPCQQLIIQLDRKPEVDRPGSPL